MRTYAKVVGVVLVLLGLSGLLDAFNIVETGWIESTYHGLVGILFLYLGFLQRDAEVVRRVVGGMGVLLLVVKGLTVVTYLLLYGDILHGPIQVTCLAVGLLSVLAAKYLHDGT